MKIVLVTFGSRGDVQPMLTLSLALQSRGHHVLLAGPPEKARWAEQLGCPYTPFGADVTTFIDSLPDAYSLSSAVAFLRFVRGQMDFQFKHFPKMIANADLVIGSSLAVALPSVADAMGIAYRYVAFTPQMLPSNGHPHPVFKHQAGAHWWNGITWKFARTIDLLYMDRVINRYRRRLGAQSTPNSWRTLLGQRTIVASDAAISTVAPDVKGSSFAQVGYMHLRQPSQTSDALERFLESGSAPIYAGFGSMPRTDQIHSVDAIVDAARRVGRRVVIAKFWDTPSMYAGSEDVFFIHQYPHLDLFPRMSAIIHHGGAGTTATSAVSGVPQVVVPQILDQYYWGHQVHRSGLGSKPIWRANLTTEKLAVALQEIFSSRQMQGEAAKVAKEIKQTDSLGMAVREVLTPL